MANKSLTISSEPKELTPTQKKEISAYLDSFGNKLSPLHKDQFISICRARGLNPLLKEIYGIPYKNPDGTPTFNIIVAYEVYLRVAEESGLLKGWKTWIEGSFQNGDYRACIEIYRDGWDHPFTHEILFNEYAQYKTYNGQQQLTKFWRTKPATMCKKVVMAQGFRLCFPSRYIGMPYIQEEAGEIGAETLENVNDEKPEVTQTKKTPEKTEKKLDVEDAQVVEQKVEPVEMTPETMREAVNKGFGPHEDFPLFLAEKRWFPEGSKLDKLTDGQIIRLYNNQEKMMNLFASWKKMKGAK